MLPDAPIDLTMQPPVHPSERDAGPRRIISLAPSITQTCFALGLGNRVIGRTQYCVHPPAARNIRRVGALVDANLEVIVALEPDLVLVTTSSSYQLTDKLVKLHLPVKQLPDSNLEDIFTAISRLGQYTNRNRTARAVVDILRADLKRLAAGAVIRNPPPSVLIVTGSLPVPPKAVWVAGPGSFIDEMVRLAGCRNALSEISKPWGEASLETIVRADPDFILEAPDQPAVEVADEVYAAWSAVGALRAIQKRTIRSSPAHTLLVPSPRVNITLYELIRLLSG